MLRTDRGDFILDNETDAILPCDRTGYDVRQAKKVRIALPGFRLARPHRLWPLLTVKFWPLDVGAGPP